MEHIELTESGIEIAMAYAKEGVKVRSDQKVVSAYAALLRSASFDQRIRYQEISQNEQTRLWDELCKPLVRMHNVSGVDESLLVY